MTDTRHRNPDPVLEQTERRLVAGWRWALTAAPRPLEERHNIGRLIAYQQRGREIEALITAAHGFEPRLGERRQP